MTVSFVLKPATHGLGPAPGLQRVTLRESARAPTPYPSRGRVPVRAGASAATSALALLPNTAATHWDSEPPSSFTGVCAPDTDAVPTPAVQVATPDEAAPVAPDAAAETTQVLGPVKENKRRKPATVSPALPPAQLATELAAQRQAEAEAERALARALAATADNTPTSVLADDEGRLVHCGACSCRGVFAAGDSYRFATCSAGCMMYFHKKGGCCHEHESGSWALGAPCITPGCAGVAATAADTDERGHVTVKYGGEAAVDAKAVKKAKEAEKKVKEAGVKAKEAATKAAAAAAKAKAVAKQPPSKAQLLESNVPLLHAKPAQPQPKLATAHAFDAVPVSIIAARVSTTLFNNKAPTAPPPLPSASLQHLNAKPPPPERAPTPPTPPSDLAFDFYGSVHWEFVRKLGMAGAFGDITGFSSTGGYGSSRSSGSDTGTRSSSECGDASAAETTNTITNVLSSSSGTASPVPNDAVEDFPALGAMAPSSPPRVVASVEDANAQKMRLLAGATLERTVTLLMYRRNATGGALLSLDEIETACYSVLRRVMSCCDGTVWVLQLSDPATADQRRRLMRSRCPAATIEFLPAWPKVSDGVVLFDASMPAVAVQRQASPELNVAALPFVPTAQREDAEAEKLLLPKNLLDFDNELEVVPPATAVAAPARAASPGFDTTGLPPVWGYEAPDAAAVRAAQVEADAKFARSLMEEEERAAASIAAVTRSPLAPMQPTAARAGAWGRPLVR